MRNKVKTPLKYMSNSFETHRNNPFLLTSFELAYRPIPYVPDEHLRQIENLVDESKRYKKSN